MHSTFSLCVSKKTCLYQCVILVELPLLWSSRTCAVVAYQKVFVSVGHSSETVHATRNQWNTCTCMQFGSCCGTEQGIPGLRSPEHFSWSVLQLIFHTGNWKSGCHVFITSVATERKTGWFQTKLSNLAMVHIHWWLDLDILLSSNTHMHWWLDLDIYCPAAISDLIILTQIIVPHPGQISSL